MNSLLLNQINGGKVLTVLIIVAVISIVFAVLIVLISKLCTVPTDETAEKIKEQLAGANCGGCGYAGCADFAKALSEGKAQIQSCGPTPNENKKNIAKIIGIPYSSEEPKYAVVHCAGGINSLNRFKYIGNKDCISLQSIQGGKKVCKEGCLGEGSCVKTCQYKAIKTVDELAKVDKNLCEACGLCVKKCPKHLIELIPKTAIIYVACSSTCKGKEVMDACKNGCIGCGICAKTCPQNAIEMIDNHPKIDYSKCIGCKLCLSKCPRKCIKEL